jgi:16S rRNA (cytidine1402-2'-O)-methyltransferase
MRGEITLVVAGAPEVVSPPDDAELAALVAAREAAGLTRKDAIADVASAQRLPKRVVFDAVVVAKS